MLCQGRLDVRSASSTCGAAGVTIACAENKEFSIHATHCALPGRSRYCDGPSPENLISRTHSHCFHTRHAHKTRTRTTQTRNEHEAAGPQGTHTSEQVPAFVCSNTHAHIHLGPSHGHGHAPGPTHDPLSRGHARCPVRCALRGSTVPYGPLSI